MQKFDGGEFDEWLAILYVSPMKPTINFSCVLHLSKTSLSNFYTNLCTYICILCSHIHTYNIPHMHVRSHAHTLTCTYAHMHTDITET